jgi:hypothetical protein
MGREFIQSFQGRNITPKSCFEDRRKGPQITNVMSKLCRLCMASNKANMQSLWRKTEMLSRRESDWKWGRNHFQGSRMLGPRAWRSFGGAKTLLQHAREMMAFLNAFGDDDWAIA